MLKSCLENFGKTSTGLSPPLDSLPSTVLSESKYPVAPQSILVESARRSAFGGVRLRLRWNWNHCTAVLDSGLHDAAWDDDHCVTNNDVINNDAINNDVIITDAMSGVFLL